MILSGETYAGFVGTTTGIFSDIKPTCGISGTICSLEEGDSKLNWGSASPDQSYVKFTGAEFTSNNPAPSFKATTWGILEFFNGSNEAGTLIDSFSLTISFHPDVGNTIQNTTPVTYYFSVTSTDNSCPSGNTPNCAADILLWNKIAYGGFDPIDAKLYIDDCLNRGNCTVDDTNIGASYLINNSYAFEVDEEQNEGGRVELIGAFGSAIPLGFGKVLNPEFSRLLTIPEPSSLILSFIGFISMLLVYRLFLLHP